MIPRCKTHAKARARSVLSSLMLSRPWDMEIEDIAFALGLTVRETDLEGCDGRLVRKGDKGIISIRRSIAEPGKKRLSIAHEIGHFDMHDGATQIEVCIDPGALSSYQRERPEEAEANVFAAELLMPEDLARPRIIEMDPGFDPIREFAKDFGVTFTAAAMRFIEFTDRRCALVFCRDSKIVWAKPSASFGYILKKDTPLNPHSYAIDYFKGGRPPGKMERLFAKAWLRDRGVDGDVEMYEQALAMERYQSVLSLLWLDRDVELQDPQPPPERREDWYQREDRDDGC